MKPPSFAIENGWRRLLHRQGESTFPTRQALAKCGCLGCQRAGAEGFGPF